MTALARAALALVLLVTMLGSAAGCGRKATPEPRKSASSSTATLIGAR
jgi:predicted small lipoprotein YifL